MLESVLSSVVSAAVQQFLKWVGVGLRELRDVESPAETPIAFQYGAWIARRQIKKRRPKKRMLANGSVLDI